MSGQPFHRCTHTALSPQGDLYVSDRYGNARVHKFTPDGRLLLSWGEPGTDPGQFNVPHNICVDPDGWVYVADREKRRAARPARSTATGRISGLGSASTRIRARFSLGSARCMLGWSPAISPRRTASPSTGTAASSSANSRAAAGRDSPRNRRRNGFGCCTSSKKSPPESRLQRSAAVISSCPTTTSLARRPAVSRRSARFRPSRWVIR
jgi:hypothetical protein